MDNPFDDAAGGQMPEKMLPGKFLLQRGGIQHPKVKIVRPDFPCGEFLPSALAQQMSRPPIPLRAGARPSIPGGSTVFRLIAGSSPDPITSSNASRIVGS